MNPSPPTEPLRLDLAQLRALAVPSCAEVFRALVRLGPASVREIAEGLGRPADGLYYHIRRLRKVELIREAGRRPTATRPELLYEVVSSRIATDPNAKSKAYTEARLKMWEGALKQFGRRLRGAELEGRPGGGLRNHLVRLSDEDVVELQVLMERVDSFLTSRPLTEGGRLVHIVLALAPGE